MKSSLRRAPAAELALLLAGMALRLFHLGAGSLWYDETVSVYLAGSPIPELLRHTAGDIHPPGYYLLLRGWLLLTGYPTGHADPHGQGLEFSSAFFSLACGVLLMALGYVLARRLLGRPGGLLAAGLLAASPFNVWYSQEVRMYTLGGALGVLAIYALLRATGPECGAYPAGAPIRQRHWRWWVVYGLAATAGMYTLYYFAFLLVPVSLWAAARIVLRRGAQAPAANVSSPGITGQNPGRPDPPSDSDIHHATERSTGAGNAGAPTAGFQPLAVNASSPVQTLRSDWRPWLLANAAPVLLYAPWLPIAWRQATQPPVPPWRTPVTLAAILRESWTALAAGQAAPDWLWPAVLLLLPVYVVGLYALARPRAVGGAAGIPSRGSIASDQKPRNDTKVMAGAARSGPKAGLAASPAALLLLATFGALATMLLASLVTPLYNVRYMYTYSAAFYIVLAGGCLWLWRHARALAALVLAGCLAASAVGLVNFWTNPEYRVDDHRAAVAFLQRQWRPGDVVVVNAGYAYTALATYWDGPVVWRGRLTEGLPPADAAQRGLVLAMTGHVDGRPGLGWNDPRSDFYAMPAAAASQSLAALLGASPRVWQYRIYDTVNDPNGRLRTMFDQDGRLAVDQVFPGEANLRVQAYVPRQGASPPVNWETASGDGLKLAAAPLPAQVTSGETLYGSLAWQPAAARTRTLATSLRLVDASGAVWAQPADEHPLGPLFDSTKWPAGAWQRQVLALPVPAGTPPGDYTVQLVVYDAADGTPLNLGGPLALPGQGLRLGQVRVNRPASAPASQPELARFGPLALIQAGSPATSLSPGDSLPVDLLWQAAAPPGEPLVVVLQLLNSGGAVAAGAEAQPLDGRYPTQDWAAGELVRDRHALVLPPDLAPGTYRLVIGIYRASDRSRLATRTGLLGQSDHYEIKAITVRNR